MVDRYNHFPSSILHSQLKTPERTSFRGFSLSKKYYFNFYASCGSTHKIEFAKQIHKFREHGPDHPLLPLCGNSPCVSRNLYKGRKNVPVGRGFSSVFARKRGFEREAARKTLVFRQPQRTSCGKSFFHAGMENGKCPIYTFILHFQFSITILHRGRIYSPPAVPAAARF